MIENKNTDTGLAPTKSGVSPTSELLRRQEIAFRVKTELVCHMQPSTDAGCL